MEQVHHFFHDYFFFKKKALVSMLKYRCAGLMPFVALLTIKGGKQSSSREWLILHEFRFEIIKIMKKKKKTDAGKKEHVNCKWF